MRPAFQHVGHLRHVEFFPDDLKLGHVVRRLDEDAVRAIVQIELGPAECLVEPVHVARISARENEGVAIDLALRGRADFRRHVGGRDHVLAGDMAAPLGRDLILEHDRRYAESLVGVQHVDDILDVAIAVVAVDHDRQFARRHDIGDGRRNLPERDEAMSGSPQRAPMVGKPPVK